jgi:hypothetical protein
VKAEKEDLSNVTVEELQEKTVRVYLILGSRLIAALERETSLVSTLMEEENDIFIMRIVVKIVN